MSHTAIFHNFMDNIGGAEIVSLTLARELGADIYTTNIDLNKVRQMGFDDIATRIHSIGKIPLVSPFRQQMTLLKFRLLDMKKRYPDKIYSKYIVSGDWAMSAVVKNKPNIWYVHSPLNELWQFKNYIKKEMMSWWKRPIFDLWVMINRRLTKKYSKHVNRWVCNSINTQTRIKRFYSAEAVVINPPTYTTRYKCEKSKDYWLSVNRLLNNKRIDIQLKAFSKLQKERLIIVGSYEKGAEQFENYKERLIDIKPSNVDILHWVDEEKLLKLYSECKGFITTARDEDFGMTVVEAMASGKPVIAPREGGYKESVIDGKTGVLIDDIDEHSLSKCIEKMSLELQDQSSVELYKKRCTERAHYFDTQNFIHKIHSVLGDFAL